MDVLILSAGIGKRFNNPIPKVLVKIKNKPLLYYSTYIFNSLDYIKNIYFVISENIKKDIEKFIKKYNKKFNKIKDIIIGGKERQHSSYNGLKYIFDNSKTDFIAIHDGCRPFIKPELINKLYYEVQNNKACAPCINVVDTIKICNKENFIIEHPKREELKAIQTPQVFDFNMIWKAYNNIDLDKNLFTDDTEIFNLYYPQNKIKLIESDNDLFKITYFEDIKKAKIIYNRIRNLWK